MSPAPVEAHAFEPHPNGKVGCQRCAYSPHHEIHAGGVVRAPAEDRAPLFYGRAPIAIEPGHENRLHRDETYVPRHRRGHRQGHASHGWGVS